MAADSFDAVVILHIMPHPELALAEFQWALKLGETFDQPMFNQMIADARAGKINLIFV